MYNDSMLIIVLCVGFSMLSISSCEDQKQNIEVRLFIDGKELISNQCNKSIEQGAGIAIKTESQKTP